MDAAVEPAQKKKKNRARSVGQRWSVADRYLQLVSSRVLERSSEGRRDEQLQVKGNIKSRTRLKGANAKIAPSRRYALYSKKKGRRRKKHRQGGKNEAE